MDWFFFIVVKIKSTGMIYLGRSIQADGLLNEFKQMIEVNENIFIVFDYYYYSLAGLNFDNGPSAVSYELCKTISNRSAVYFLSKKLK